MRIESLHEGASGAATIAAGGSSFIVDAGQLEALGLPLSALAPGIELDEGEEATLRLAASAREAERRALALLARAEQSSYMLKCKLELRDFPPEAIRLALERLGAQGWLDDARFARAYATARLSRRVEGPGSLVAALRARGVDQATAKEAVAAVLGPEERREALGKAWARELKRASGDRDEARSRLRALGFSSSELREYLESHD